MNEHPGSAQPMTVPGVPVKLSVVAPTALGGQVRAVAGTFTAGFFLLPSLGLSWTNAIAACTNLTLAVLIARALPHRRLRIFAVAVGAGLALMIGVSRVYLGVHYPTDVLAGWTVGLAWALTCGLLARWLAGRGQVEAAGPAEDTAA